MILATGELAEKTMAVTTTIPGTCCSSRWPAALSAGTTMSGSSPSPMEQAQGTGLPSQISSEREDMRANS